MDILAMLLAIGLGFGLACLIFATILSKSNDIGNSIGEVSKYSNGIYYDQTADKLKNSTAIDSFGLSYITKDDRSGVVPPTEKKVEQPAVEPRDLGWNSDKIR